MARQRTFSDSVLFNEYEFEHELYSDNIDSYNVHDVSSIEKPVLLLI